MNGFEKRDHSAKFPVFANSLFVSVIHTLVAPPFLENQHVIKYPANLAPYLPSGKAERLYFQVIAAAMPPVQTIHVSFG